MSDSGRPRHQRRHGRELRSLAARRGRGADAVHLVGEHRLRVSRGRPGDDARDGRPGVEHGVASARTSRCPTCAASAAARWTIAPEDVATTRVPDRRAEGVREAAGRSAAPRQAAWGALRDVLGRSRSSPARSRTRPPRSTAGLPCCCSRTAPRAPSRPTACAPGDGGVRRPRLPAGRPLMIERVKRAWDPARVAARAVRLVARGADRRQRRQRPARRPCATVCIHGDAPNASRSPGR